jgi:hypothetical protein
MFSQFTLAHTEVADSKAQKVNGPDIVLRAQCGYYLSYTGINQGKVSVSLNEYAGWKDSRTGRPPTVTDVLGVLNHLQTVMIRGGYYSSAETTTISGVSIYPGKV